MGRLSSLDGVRREPALSCGSGSGRRLSLILFSITGSGPTASLLHRTVGIDARDSRLGVHHAFGLFALQAGRF